MLEAIAAAELANGCADGSEDRQFTTHVVGCEGAFSTIGGVLYYHCLIGGTGCITLVTTPAVLLLDEATSAVITKPEKLVQAVLLLAIFVGTSVWSSHPLYFQMAAIPHYPIISFLATPYLPDRPRLLLLALARQQRFDGRGRSDGAHVRMGSDQHHAPDDEGRRPRRHESRLQRRDPPLQTLRARPFHRLPQLSHRQRRLLRPHAMALFPACAVARAQGDRAVGRGK